MTPTDQDFPDLDARRQYLAFLQRKRRLLDKQIQQTLEDILQVRRIDSLKEKGFFDAAQDL